MSVRNLLNRVIGVTRLITTDDGGGGRSSDWIDIGSTPGRLSQPTAQERERAAPSGADLTHVVYLPPDADVRRGDRLAVDGLELEVLATMLPSKPAYLQADCRQRQGEEPM